MVERLRRRLRADEGFGLVELLIAMLIMNVALLSILAAFTAGNVAVRRASRQSTAATLADTQMELYRALTYAAIALDTSAVGLTDSTYRNDTALGGNIANDITGTCTTPLPAQCNPSRTLTGPDHGAYRIDTYIVTTTPVGGRPEKLVTVVVRDPNKLSGLPYARESSAFDQSTGQ